MTTNLSISVADEPVGRRQTTYLLSLRKMGVSALYPLIAFATLILVYEAVRILLSMPAFVMPSSAAVYQSIIDYRQTLLSNFFVTAWEVVLGFLAAVAIAVPLGVVMAEWRTAERLLYPVLFASQAVPKVALAPIIAIWFGFGMLPKIILAALIAFFPILVSTFVGLTSCEPETKQLGRIIGFSRFAMLRKVVFPGALPSVFGGMKVGVALAVVGAIVAEYISAQKGIGYLLINASAQMQINLMFAAMVVASMLGIILFTIIGVLERILVPWHFDKALQGTN